MPEGQTDPQAALDRVDAALDAIDRLAPVDETFAKVHRLAEALVGLGMLAQLHPEALSDEASRTRLTGQARRLTAISNHLAAFQMRWEAKLWSGFEERWQSLCVARSAFDFLIDLYRPALDDETELAVDPEELRGWDAYIAEQFDAFGGIAEERIQAGIPESHWWWRDGPL